MNCAVFASGSGSNFQALIDKKESGELHATLALLISNNRSAKALERARTHHIAAECCAPSHYETEAAYVLVLQRLLDLYQIELIILAGYMKKIPAAIVQKYRHRIINIHPALLPAFGGKGLYGHYVHEAVLDYGAKISGITVHFVDEEYDHGPVILQQVTALTDTDTPDTLAAKVLTLEHAWYWRAVDAIACGKIRIQGRRVYGQI